ncbi:hypothetical protein EG871_10835, partial [Enterococcus faecium]
YQSYSSMFSAKNIVLLTEINGFFDASLLHNYMDVINKEDLDSHKLISYPIIEKQQIKYIN